MRMQIEPLVLTGRHVRLEPLTPEHVDALNAAARDGELWKLWFTGVPDAAHMSAWIDAALMAAARGTDRPFVVRLLDSGEIVGSTRYCNVEMAHRRLEIGYTWYAARVQRSAVNTECKLLLLQHAFESLRCVRVEFCTHWHNRRSRAAIERLGAKQDGVLRNHRILEDGSLRDTVVYSILDSEWAAVRNNLLFKLDGTLAP
ncbi:MAG TPA: GNAT family protein [Rhodanobacteraceae bacterium]|nr:GNAT family protein [Rhodanobacteraceae bacterium]